MKFSLHSIIRGKPEKVKDADGRTWLVQNGQRVNPGFGWTSIEASWDDAFDAITVDGCAVAPYLSSDNRKESNFVECSLAFIDVDCGMTIPQLFEHPFYESFGAGFYATPSHTDSEHRFRIIHRLETPISSADKMRKLYRALMGEYGNADVSCKDAARLFYGTVGCAIKEKRHNTLPDSIVDYLINEISERDAMEVKEYEEKEYPPLSDGRKQFIIDLLKRTYIGQYEQWRNVGWGMRKGGFTLTDFQNVTAGMMSEKSASDAKTVWNDFKDAANGPTMGTVIHLLRTRHGKDCLGDVDTRQEKVSKYVEHLKEIQMLESILRIKKESQNV